jgi:TetR/AcrR family transcriptional repressor of mexCD-oprJ operon
MVMGTHEEELLKKLTAALSANPRSSTGALARAAGISRATFNRLFGSRENLMELIAEQGEKTLQNIIALAQETVTDYAASLTALVEAHAQDQEYLVFVCGTQSSLENAFWAQYLGALDHFFLAGQKTGAFRVDIPYPMLTELFVSMICGMIDAQRRGRVAVSGLERQMAEFFLHGTARQTES